MYKCTTCEHFFDALSVFAVIADCEDLSYSINWDMSVPFDNVQCLLNGRNLGRCELVC